MARTGPKPKPLIERFLGLIEPVDDWDACIEWRGSKTVKGYGSFNESTAHRFAYSQFVGPLHPDSRRFTVDHLCGNVACVNPWHLELVPHQVNSLRGRGSITHCHNGHEFTPENTIIEKDGHRRCRKCRDAKNRRALARFTAERRNVCECGRAISRRAKQCPHCMAVRREALIRERGYR